MEFMALTHVACCNTWRAALSLTKTCQQIACSAVKVWKCMKHVAGAQTKPVVKWCMVKMAADDTPVGVLHVIMSPPKTNAGVLGVRQLTPAMWGRLGHILRGWTRRQLKIHLWYRHTHGMGMRQMALKVWQVFSISFPASLWVIHGRVVPHKIWSLVQQATGRAAPASRGPWHVSCPSKTLISLSTWATLTTWEMPKPSGTMSWVNHLVKVGLEYLGPRDRTPPF